MQLNSTTTSCKVAFHQFFIGLGPPVADAPLELWAEKRSVKAKTADVVLVKKMDNLTVAENSLKLVPASRWMPFC